MLDGKLRRLIEPGLEKLARKLAAHGITPDQVTLVGFGFGVLATMFIALGWSWLALLPLLISRLADGLDGSLAKITKASDFGGFLDIVLDFAFYGMIVFGFILADPGKNAIAGGLLLLSFYVNGASFLAFASIAEKRRMNTQARGKKSIFFTTGLAEASETLFVFILFCLFPAWFVTIGIIFALICFYTALSRIIEARSTFAD